MEELGSFVLLQSSGIFQRFANHPFQLSVNTSEFISSPLLNSLHGFGVDSQYKRLLFCHAISPLNFIDSMYQYLLPEQYLYRRKAQSLNYLPWQLFSLHPIPPILFSIINLMPFQPCQQRPQLFCFWQQ
jgi:hypothetical protein